MLAPVVTISESGDNGGHGVTSTESQVESEAPPSGESDSTIPDGGADVVQSAGSDNSLMQSLAQLVKTDRLHKQGLCLPKLSYPCLILVGMVFKLVMMALNAGWNSSRNGLNYWLV